MCLGVPGKIIDIYQAGGLSMGVIDFGGVTREVCLAYVPEAKIGDYAIIHVGFALNLVSEQEAQETLDLFKQIADAGMQGTDDSSPPSERGPSAGQNLGSGEPDEIPG
jgi:hydrogenase expression/formation protein HypC